MYEKLIKQLLDIQLELHNAGVGLIADNIEDILEDLKYAKDQGYIN